MFDRIDKGLWWDVGLSLIEGCSFISEGCIHCWSLTAANMRRFNPNPKMQARYDGVVRLESGNPKWTGQVNLQWKDLDKIGRSRKPKVYTFWIDLFHEGVSFDLADGKEKFMDEVIIKILTRPEHFYIICTKRPKRALEYFLSRQTDLGCWPDAKTILSSRLMLMTTAENQAMADLRVPVLLQIPGVLHGVSVEPMLSGIDVWQYLGGNRNPIGPTYGGKGLDWVIAGPETGPRRRPADITWFNSLLSQCKSAGVPYFQKALEIDGKISKNMDEWPEHLRVREVPHV